MRIRLLTFLVPLVVLVFLAASPGFAKQEKVNAEEEAALQKCAEAFVEAFHKGEAKALAALWTPDGDYTDQRGRHFKGREAIEKVFSELFAENKGLKLRINIEGIRFPIANVAVEDGTTEVSPEHGPPSRARYTVMHIKKDGQWLIDSVRDAMYVPPTNYEFLRGLEFAIGDWVAESPTGEGAHLSFSWAPHQNFLINKFTTTFREFSLGEGTQWIGWDPAAKTIRAWTFDTTGGFGEATWSKDGDKWVTKVASVQRDGTKTTATNIVTLVDQDTLEFQSTERTINGKSAPDIKGIKLKRVK
jgi:uncharacterized protein (TIGR02246 family)